MSVESWSRVMNLLREHAPADHADLPGPATEQMLRAAEARMGIALPGDLRAWLLQNNLDLPEEEVEDPGYVGFAGFAGFPDEGSFFLGIRAIEWLHGNHPMPWRAEWIPIVSDQDSWTGLFLDARDGRIGKWFVGENIATGTYASLADYFDSVAGVLQRIADGTHPYGSFTEGRLVWS
ncbi:SMI1/KNR4 family protein [Streptomyces sp. HUAS MG47]|uniref:SMI1/KNR4 family protein n=2 Tax=Streptomyces marianii TaxID=1817406 RepID=A0A5R9E8Y9_9ACTN|nr:SMI1/KNR4 family protein [Streptomyces marianii]